MFPRHPCFEFVSFLVVSASVARRTRCSYRVPYFAHGSGAPGFFTVDPRQYNMSTTGEFLARLVNLENEAVNNVSSSYPQEAVHLHRQKESHRHAHTWQAPKTFTGQPAEWTTWQFTFKAFACATHSRMRDVFESATRKGSDLVVNSDMTPEVQSLSTQLFYMLVMMLSDQAVEIVRRSVVQVALGVRAWRWYQIRSNVLKKTVR